MEEPKAAPLVLADAAPVVWDVLVVSAGFAMLPKSVDDGAVIAAGAVEVVGVVLVVAGAGVFVEDSVASLF